MTGSSLYVGTWLVFGVILLPVYGMLVAWFIGKPRKIRKAFLGLGLLFGIAAALWVGLYLVSMLFHVVFYRA